MGPKSDTQYTTEEAPRLGLGEERRLSRAQADEGHTKEEAWIQLRHRAWGVQAKPGACRAGVTMGQSPACQAPLRGTAWIGPNSHL